MPETVWLGFAFFLGILAYTAGLPPLVGYLAAGFALSGVASVIDLPLGDGAVLKHISHLGVLLLLFTVGLKLKIKSLFRPEVIGGGLIHFAITTALFAPAISYFGDIPWRTAVLLAIALSFSSTVLAAKMLDAKRELRAFHGRVAIGILIVQDLIALLVMGIAASSTPSLWALVIFAMPLLRVWLYRLLDATGHEELMLLFGLLLALAAGGYGFEAVGMSSELGALLFGALLANHPRAKELSDSLWGIKEIFLVGFFLQIGIGGLPDGEALLMALIFAIVLPLKGVLFFFLLLLFKLRSRSAFLSSLTLTNYSEFGLILASVVLPEWLVPLALTVTLSFIVSAPINRLAHPLYEALAQYLSPFERDLRHPDEQPISLGSARILIMGMGRTGSAAYDRLQEIEPGLIGLDSDPAKLNEHKKRGRNVFFADAEDPVFWANLEMPDVRSIVLAMSDIEAKLIATRKLRQRGYEGLIVTHTMYPEEAEAIRHAGADHAYLTFCETGVGLAERVREEMVGA